MTEAAIQRAIIELALWRGCLVIRINQGGMEPKSGGWVWFTRWQILGDDKHTSGVSDLFILPPAGPWLIIEVKRPGETVRPSQSKFIAAVRGRGGRVEVIDNFDEFRMILDEVLK